MSRGGSGEGKELADPCLLARCRHFSDKVRRALSRCPVCACFD